MWGSKKRRPKFTVSWCCKAQLLCATQVQRTWLAISLSASWRLHCLVRYRGSLMSDGLSKLARGWDTVTLIRAEKGNEVVRSWRPATSYDSVSLLTRTSWKVASRFTKWYSCFLLWRSRIKFFRWSLVFSGWDSPWFFSVIYAKYIASQIGEARVLKLKIHSQGFPHFLLFNSCGCETFSK
jgi:hypothetical protein